MLKAQNKKIIYKTYIQSPEWRKKKLTYLSSKLPKDCSGCNESYRSGFHLHHRTYRRLGNERLTDLVMLCPTCHNLVHAEATRDLWKHTKKVLKKQRRRTDTE